MNTDGHPFDETIRHAVEQHGAAVAAHAPEFGDLIAARHRRTRRMLGVATLCIALLGLGGISVAASRNDNGTSATRPTDLREITTTARPTVTYSCTDPIGEDQLGRQLFGSCDPAPNGADGDYACTDRIREQNGFVVFATCESVGPLGQLPGSDGDASFEYPEGPAVRSTTYVVQYGDIPTDVAAQHCVSVDALAIVNGWEDPWGDFPVVGTEILIPAGTDDSTCDVVRYTITADDITRTGVADRFCISVQALDAANVDTEGYSGFYPGLEIIIPTSPSTTC